MNHRSSLSPEADAATQATIRRLAQFRYGLRKFVRFSEESARACGITPQQHQLMLGVAGFAEGGKATVTQLAEFLQEKHHSVVGLVERAVHSGLVRREQSTVDRRVVLVSLTEKGEDILWQLSQLHAPQVQTVLAMSALLEEEAGR